MKASDYVLLMGFFNEKIYNAILNKDLDCIKEYLCKENQFRRQELGLGFSDGSMVVDWNASVMDNIYEEFQKAINEEQTDNYPFSWTMK